MTRQTFPWPVAVTPTRVCLIRSIRFLPSSLSLRAEQTFHVYRFRSRSWIIVVTKRREKTLPRGSLSLSPNVVAWCIERNNIRLRFVVRVIYRYHAIVSDLITYHTFDYHPEHVRHVRILFYFRYKNTVCRDNTFSRSSISNVSSYTICKSHLTSSRVLSVPASRAPIHRFVRIMNIPMNISYETRIVACATHQLLL